MFLDKYLSYNDKVLIALFSAALWIYYRTAECYAMIPRKSVFAVVFVVVWLYLYSYEPLFCPLGLSVLFLYSKIGNHTNFKL